MLTLNEFKNARSVLSGVISKTSLVYSPAFSKATGNNVYIKPENMQVTGAYKIRGAYYKISTLTEEEKSRGLITASAGNHAQGVAYAAQAAGVSATIVMPTTTPLVKVNNTKDYGAEVILHGETFDDAAALAAQLSEERGLTYVHPFNDPAIATGQGTISYEIFQDLPDVDVILVPIGGGGLATGVATLAKLLNPSVTVIGVEPTGAACMKASLEAGHVVTLPTVNTIADGVAVKTPGDQIFPFIQQNLDDIITIDDSELVDAFLDMMEKHKMIVENAGLLPIAALSHLKCRGSNVVPVLSGGNMDVITISSLVQHGLINRGRVFTFSVQLPDRPGELLRVAQVVAKENGNIIKLEHNQFVNINRQAGVELKVTTEAFGHVHKNTILDALRAQGYDAQVVNTIL
ncbi:threonine ammonia-lyase [Pseudoflavonifractor phocaeensis]|uniref:threonine ammonia-lyase n=1 Tax=Pseudoflavonifractor phocaeensis TaxID=1870988 RepID=UPI001957FC69|nr:threonine ammonia-lyase [Pseudoflavonifractor phocaeensis]MBM6869862.1 threonine ammonia-lyase [Pseudoflavonifractor phocaeensis]MBM6939548.1 threonine ammonia-lyase [Pseudoflavonifractor phocaeensis]